VKRIAGWLALLVVLMIVAPGARRTILRVGAPNGIERNGVLSPRPPEFQDYVNRVEARAAVADQVLAGRMTLVEAADTFLRICGDRAPQILEWAPGNSVKEKLCRQVLVVVKNREMELSLGSTVSQRLEIELTHLLADESSDWLVEAAPAPPKYSPMSPE
jgi:hypothetical protein